MDGRPAQARVGYRVRPQDIADVDLIPLGIRKQARLYLWMLFKLEPDKQGKYLQVNSSVMLLSLDQEGHRELLHYDYERDKPDGYPEAHLQVCATSDAWKQLTQNLGRKGRPLEKLHLPVGGRRYRPTVEDLIEFLVTERLVEARSSWRQLVEDGRTRFQERQLRAAIRRRPDVALDILRDEGL